jgi:hypothetical protein
VGFSPVLDGACLNRAHGQIFSLCEWRALQITQTMARVAGGMEDPLGSETQGPSLKW